MTEKRRSWWSFLRGRDHETDLAALEESTPESTPPDEERAEPAEAVADRDAAVARARAAPAEPASAAARATASAAAAQDVATTGTTAAAGIAEGSAGAPAVAPAVPPSAPTATAERGGWFTRLRDGLTRSSNRLGEQVSGLFTKTKLDPKSLQELEDILIEADLGVETAMRITDRLSEGRYSKGIAPEELQGVLAEEVERVLAPLATPLDVTGKTPFVVLVVGVNGTGKTTTIGKIAAKAAREGRRVVLAAGDTFRAAAVEQLRIWGERSGARVVSGAAGADPAGLVFEAIDAAKGADLLVIDTAGRLQNKAELMAELEKIVRVIRRRLPDAPHAVLLTLDATTGQNALNQVDIFREKVGVTGLVMTKLDGTARGGILVAIAAKHGLPIHYIGVGEGIDDLAPFAARDFARAIAGL